MKYRSLLAAFLSTSVLFGYAQIFKSKESHVHFFSDAPVEDIEAINTSSSSIIDMDNGNIVFSVPINQFQFAKSLMQEHFNENYLESHKFPKATFVGKMNVNELKEGLNSVKVSGEMSIHGVKQSMEVQGTLFKLKDAIQAHAEFPILLEDFSIKIPKAVFYNIAEKIAVTIDFTYEKI